MVIVYDIINQVFHFLLKEYYYIVALRELPNFTADPHSGSAGAPHHRCTIHLNCEETEMLDKTYKQGRAGLIPDRY